MRFFIFSLFQDAFKTIEKEEKEMSNGAFVQESRGGDRKEVKPKEKIYLEKPP